MPQCRGRRTTPKSAPLFFADCPRLHRNKPLSFLGPVRCLGEAEDLCRGCLLRLKSTENQLEKRGNKYIPNQETMLHGRIGEAIPEWSRLYRGAWFEEQLTTGYTLSKETQEIAEKMLEATYKENPTRSVGPMIHGSVVEIDLPVKKKVVKKTVAKVEKVEKVKKPAPIPIPQKAETPKSEPTPRKKVVKLKKTEPIGFIAGVLEGEPIVKKVPVKKTEIDGVQVYLDPIKDKVYDLKFVYAGRYDRKENQINRTYADSDADAEAE